MVLKPFILKKNVLIAHKVRNLVPKYVNKSHILFSLIAGFHVYSTTPCAKDLILQYGSVRRWSLVGKVLEYDLQVTEWSFLECSFMNG